MKNTATTLLAVLMMFSLTAHSITVQGLYEGTVPIVDKSNQSQNKGIRAALLQVLVKITGKRSAAGIYGVDAILKEPNRYLQQYEIRNLNQDESSQSPDYFLWAKFDANVLQSAMREYSIPIWSQERPSTLIWFVLNDQQTMVFPNMSRGSYFHDTLQYRANARGISLLTPLLDSTDRANLQGKDIAAATLPRIQSASERYPSDSILTAVVNRLGQELWQINWLAVVDGEARRWETSGSSAAEAIGEGIDSHADKLAAKYSQQVGYAGENQFDIRIEGISNFAAYARTLHYLQSLNFISQVSVLHAVDSIITYGLTAHGNVTNLEQAAALGQTIRPIGDGQTFQYLP